MKITGNSESMQRYGIDELFKAHGCKVALLLRFIDKSIQSKWYGVL